MRDLFLPCRKVQADIAEGGGSRLPKRGAVREDIRRAPRWIHFSGQRFHAAIVVELKLVWQQQRVRLVAHEGHVLFFLRHVHVRDLRIIRNR